MLVLDISSDIHVFRLPSDCSVCAPPPCVLRLAQWLPKEPNRFKRGLVSFAGGGKDSRGTEMFVAYSDTALGAAPHEVPARP